MKLIKPKFEILEQTDLFQHIERCGRTAYKSEDKITEDSAMPFYNMLVKRNHTAVLEHGTIYLTIYEPEKPYIGKKYNKNKYSVVKYVGGTYYITTNCRVLLQNNWLSDMKYSSNTTQFHEKRISVKIICDRGVSHEFVRHRIFSFVQESTRYCNYSNDKFGKELTYIIPEWLDLEEGHYGYNIEGQIESDTRFYEAEDDLDLYLYLDSLLLLETNYLTLTDKITRYANPHSFWTPQQARAILPNSLKTELIITGTISQWVGFFKLRCDIAAHPQARELVIPLEQEFIKRKYV